MSWGMSTSGQRGSLPSNRCGSVPFFARAYLARFANGMQIKTLAVMTAIINQASLMASVSAAFSTRGLSIDRLAESSGCAYCLTNMSSGMPTKLAVDASPAVNLLAISLVCKDVRL